MLHTPNTDAEGSFFCERCKKEAKRNGRCKCGGKISFINVNDERYIDFVMKSKLKGTSDVNLSYARIYERDPNNKEEIHWL